MLNVNWKFVNLILAITALFFAALLINIGCSKCLAGSWIKILVSVLTVLIAVIELGDVFEDKTYRKTALYITVILLFLSTVWDTGYENVKIDEQIEIDSTRLSNITSNIDSVIGKIDSSAERLSEVDSILNKVIEKDSTRAARIITDLGTAIGKIDSSTENLVKVDSSLGSVEGVLDNQVVKLGTLVDESTRLLNPIKEFSISYSMGFSLKEPFAKGYNTRIKKVKDSLKNSEFRLNPDTYPEFTRGKEDTRDGGWRYANISKKSKYFPNTTSELMVRQQITPKLRFGFFKDSIDFQRFLREDLPRYFQEGKTPLSTFDLLIPADSYFDTPTDILDSKDEIEALLSVKSTGIVVRTLPNKFIETNSDNWVGNGKITSLADFKGSYMIILNRTTVPKRSEIYDYNQRQLEFYFGILRIRVAPGLELNVTTEFFETYRFPRSGYTIQYYQFPTKEFDWNYIWTNPFN